MVTTLRFTAETGEMRERLFTALRECGIASRNEGKIVVVENCLKSSGPGGSANVVGLLREALSPMEREAVSLVEELEFPREFPVTTRLEAWWSVFETSWFEKALAADDFSVWFQPVVDTVARRTIGYECMLRLTRSHRRHGAEILAAAAERRTLHDFDIYTRRLAIRTLVAQQAKPGMCFLNFIPGTLDDPDWCMQETLESLREAGMSAGNFVMEAVGTNRYTDLPHLRKIGDRLREQGMGFALDDLGVNADALRLICNLRPDYVKLERRAVVRMEQSREFAAIHRLVEVAERLGVRVVAKGVERVTTMEKLWAAGVQYMQGYLLGGPAPEVSSVAADLSSLARTIELCAQPDSAILAAV